MASWFENIEQKVKARGELIFNSEGFNVFSSLINKFADFYHKVATNVGKIELSEKVGVLGNLVTKLFGGSIDKKAFTQLDAINDVPAVRKLLADVKSDPASYINEPNFVKIKTSQFDKNSHKSHQQQAFNKLQPLEILHLERNAAKGCVKGKVMLLERLQVKFNEFSSLYKIDSEVAENFSQVINSAISGTREPISLDTRKAKRSFEQAVRKHRNFYFDDAIYDKLISFGNLAESIPNLEPTPKIAILGLKKPDQQVEVLNNLLEDITAQGRSFQR